MPDEIVQSPAPAGEPVVPPTADPTATPAADPPLSTQEKLGDELGSNEAPTKAEGPDWRAEMAGGDEKVLSKLKRYKDPVNVAKALVEAQTALSKRSEVNWDDPAAARKQLGVPEAIEEYAIKPAREKLSEGETQLFEGFRGKMHELAISPKQAQALTDFYFDRQTADEQAWNERAQQAIEANKKAIKEEFGNDYKRNLAAAATFLDKHVDGDRKSLADLQLIDGTPLGDHPAFLKFTVNAALATLDDDQIITPSDGGGAGVSVDQRYKDIINMQFQDPTRYRSPEVQDELHKLAELRNRRGAK
jgi:hypothetical protein